jgi:hypothetical protein
MTLREGDIWVLKAWAAGDDIPLAKRAKVLLTTHAGMTQIAAGQHLDCPVRSVARWLAKYQRHGLGGLIDSGVRGRRMPMRKQRAIVTYLVRNQASLITLGKCSESVTSVAKRLGRSEDVIRRISRLTGIPLKNDHQGRLDAFIDSGIETSGLVGLWLTHSLWVAVFQGDSPWRKPMSEIGAWIAPGKAVRERLSKQGVPLHQRIPLAMAIHGAARHPDRALPDRRKAEAFRHWANMLVFADPPLAKSLHLVAGGDVTDPFFKKLLLMTKPPAKGPGESRIPISMAIVPDAHSWLHLIEKARLIEKNNELLPALDAFVSNQRDGRFVAWYRSD